MKQTTKTKYVYKLCTTKVIFANLESAVTGAYFDIITQIPATIKVTKPMLTKITGGYMVTMIANNGKAYTRQIDVFKPIELGDLVTAYNKVRYKDKGWRFTDEQMQEIQNRINELEETGEL